jgi:hypothetical protein
MMNEAQAITWKDDPGEFRGDPGTAVAVDRSRWEELGAHFSEVDNGDGMLANVATGLAKNDDFEVEFGILDYGAPSTFVLVPVAADEAKELTEVVLAVMEMEGIITDDDLPPNQDTAEPDSLEKRLEAVEYLSASAVLGTMALDREIIPRLAIEKDFPALAPTRGVLSHLGIWGNYDPWHGYLGNVRSLLEEHQSESSRALDITVERSLVGDSAQVDRLVISFSTPHDDEDDEAQQTLPLLVPPADVPAGEKD